MASPEIGRGFRDVAAHPKGANWLRALDQVDRLIASDVIWNDFFVTPTGSSWPRTAPGQGTVPASVFLDADPATATVLADLQGKTTSPGGSSQPPVLQLGDTAAGEEPGRSSSTSGSPSSRASTKLTVSGV